MDKNQIQIKCFETFKEEKGRFLEWGNFKSLKVIEGNHKGEGVCMSLKQKTQTHQINYQKQISHTQNSGSHWFREGYFDGDNSMCMDNVASMPFLHDRSERRKLIQLSWVTQTAVSFTSGKAVFETCGTFRSSYYSW